MDHHISRDAAVAMFAKFLDDQLATGKQGERRIAFSLDSKKRITSMRGLAKPDKYERLPMATLGEETPVCSKDA